MSKLPTSTCFTFTNRHGFGIVSARKTRALFIQPRLDTCVTSTINDPHLWSSGCRMTSPLSHSHTPTYARPGPHVLPHANEETGSHIHIKFILHVHTYIRTSLAHVSTPQNCRHIASHMPHNLAFKYPCHKIANTWLKTGV